MNILYIAELVGTYFFSISGVLATEDKDRNWLGVSFTGFVTAIGGEVCATCCWAVIPSCGSVT